MEARWLTTSSASPAPPQPIPDAAHAWAVPQLLLGQTGSSKHSPEAMSRAINVLAVLYFPPTPALTPMPPPDFVVSHLPAEHHEASRPRSSHRAIHTRWSQRPHSLQLRRMGGHSHGSQAGDSPTFIRVLSPLLIGFHQRYIRLHVILNIGAEMRTYHELFKRSVRVANAGTIARSC